MLDFSIQRGSDGLCDFNNRKLSEKEAKTGENSSRLQHEIYGLLWDSLSTWTKALEVDIRLLNVFKP